jgi:tRNA(Ile)-lysidine synthase
MLTNFSVICNVKEKFLRFIQEQKLLAPQPHIMAAVSGGIDSVVLARLLHEQGWLSAIAHVNYGKRDAESDADAVFVEELAASLNVIFHVKKTNAAQVEAFDGDGFQEKARNYRYAYFEDLCDEFGYTQIATGHQLDDNLETLLHRLFRGAGIHGLRGIPVKNNRIIRPLLVASREEIVSLATTQGWAWREDASNQELTFQRNKIRHQFMPLLKSWNPNLYEGLSETFGHLRDTELIFNEAIEASKKSAVWVNNTTTHIRIASLLSAVAPVTMLYEWIRPYGFNNTQAQQLVNGLNETTPAVFYADEFVLSKERDELVIAPKEKKEVAECVFEPDGHLGFLQWEFSDTTSLRFEQDSNVAFLDAEKLQWPLTIRSWKIGDRMRPFGMQGTKKVSDILTDLKVARLNRDKLPVLLSGEDIVWMPGFRIAHDYAVSATTKQQIKFTFKPGAYG